MKSHFIFPCCFSILISLFGYQYTMCQTSNIGIPPVISFPKKLTNAATQTWSISEDNYGYTWFANNAGILKFDGYTWELYTMPNNTIARSLAVDNQTNKIFVGCQGDFGYLAPEKSGIYRFPQSDRQQLGIES